MANRNVRRNAKQRKSNAFSSFKVLRTSKAQIIGQVFVFILAGLVFVLIITYGYKAIQYFMEQQEQVVLLDFRTDLERTVEGVKRDYGTVRKIELTLPNKYQGVCFFDLDSSVCDPNESTVEPKLKLPDQNIGVKWAEDACKLKGANVFTVPREEGIELPDIKIENGWLCVPNLDGITLRMEGTGRKAKISKWSQ